MYSVIQQAFSALPDSPFAYWLSDAMRGKFRELPRLEGRAGQVRQGLATGDDFRFVRAAWEVSPKNISIPCEEPLSSKRWAPFAKGGEYRPLFEGIHLLVNWADDGAEIRSALHPRTGRPLSRSQNTRFYFRPGLTFPRRTRRICPKAFPAGSIFSHGGQACFPLEGATPASLVGLLASKTFFYLLKPYLPREDADPQYEVGEIQRIPVPQPSQLTHRLDQAALRAIRGLQSTDRVLETSHTFSLPVLAMIPGQTLADRLAGWNAELRAISEGIRTELGSIDKACYQLYGIDSDDQRTVEREVGTEVRGLPGPLTPEEAVAALLSWAVGVAMGRFDLRFATGQRPLPELPDPFAPLPACSPSMLPEGKVPDGYALRVVEDGILVDDEGHDWDIVTRVREVFHLIFGDQADAIEREAWQILEVPSARDYFTQLGTRGFWDDHVKRYSRSRRRAPIYWLLRSPKGLYSTWVYYHRLGRDTLHRLLGTEYLGGRIQRVRQAIEELRPGGQTKQGITKKQERRLADLDDLLVDLEEFSAEIRAVITRANDLGETVGYDPDLDDGVVLNAAPLHDLIPWPRKKKHRGQSMNELEAYWEELAEDKYDWAHIAMRYWPTRVTEKCRSDKSLALAHGLDAQFFPGLRDALRRQADTASAPAPSDEELVDDEVEEDDE